MCKIKFALEGGVMIKMEDYEYIRLAYYRYKHSIRKISRDSKISRKAIRRAINADEPKYVRTKPVKKPVMGQYEEIITRWLIADKEMHIKQRHTAKRIYDRLVEEHGFKGGKSTVRGFVKELKEKLNLDFKEVFIASDPELREGAEMDWGEVEIEISGKKTKVYMFCLRSKYSGKIFVKLYPVMLQECFFNGHMEAFMYFGGVFKEIVYDNLKSAVKKILKGRSRIEQTSFIAFRAYYCYKSEFCNPSKGSEKGGVEGLVKYARRNYLVPMLQCSSLEEANEYLLKKCKMRDQDTTHGQKFAIGELFEKEKKKLLALPEKPYNNYKLIVEAKSDKYSTVTVANNRYSIPEKYSGKKLEIELGLSDVRIIHKKTLIAKHEREFEKNKWVLDPYHYLETLSRKSKAFKTSRVRSEMEKSWPQAILKLWQVQVEKIGDEKGTKSFIQTIKHFYNKDLKELADLCELAIENGTTCFDSIKMLHDALSEENANIQEVSVKHIEKIADIQIPSPNIDKFDSLLEVKHG